MMGVKIPGEIENSANCKHRALSPEQKNLHPILPPSSRTLCQVVLGVKVTVSRKVDLGVRHGLKDISLLSDGPEKG